MLHHHRHYHQCECNAREQLELFQDQLNLVLDNQETLLVAVADIQTKLEQNTNIEAAVDQLDANTATLETAVDSANNS